MKNLRSLLVLMAAMTLVACGGGDDDGTILAPPGGDGGGGDGDSTVSTIEVFSSAPTITSDQGGNSKVTITALVKDANNNVLPSIGVTISANAGGALSDVSSVTDGNGLVTAKLSNGSDPTERAITVTASAGSVSDSVTVNVTGTSLSFSGPSLLALGATNITYSVLLEDGQNVGIPNASIAVASANGNAITPSTLITDANGQAQFQLTASVPGTDQVSVSSFGESFTANVSVSNDSFAFISPDPGVVTEVNLDTSQLATVRWISGGVPQAGQNITFNTTRGTITESSGIANDGVVTTNAAGEATISLSSSNAGPALVSATTPGVSGGTTTLNLEFVAVTASTLQIQADPTNVVVSQSSEITAIVRDPAGNLVKNKTVVFVLDDVTNGTLSVVSDVTDSQGMATTFYLASSTSSAENGVHIQGYVQGTSPLVEDTVDLTVVGQAADVSLGTGDKLFEIGTAIYAKEWVIFVTDSAGAPVTNANVQASLRSLRYRKGQLVAVPLDSPTQWVPLVSTEPGEPFCADEDVNRNNFLDPGEDLNASNKIEAGNVATVAPVLPTADPDDPCSEIGTPGSSASVLTNSQGYARVCVLYPRSYNLWVDVRLRAATSVFGTETAESQDFTLDALTDDILDTDSAPSGQFSPFGQGTTCADPN